ncbi:MAG: hypothetical protein MK198_00750 [Gracilimonas sp.]|uniref:hypothetical protein n=1 Tax=Gracilimonas sp. TaxID=1974203 RepID=UPI00375097DF|nr:hypothetical protein [Gracilimonas sp.]
MKKINIITSVLFVFALFMFLNFSYSSENNEMSFSGESVCAQTGTCAWSPPDNCYVNGEKDPGRKWVDGSPVIEE